MSEQRRHPDLFTPEEAAAYLAVTPTQLETLETDFGLLGHKVGRVRVYWRKDLDACACAMVGEQVPAELARVNKGGLRMAR